MFTVTIDRPTDWPNARIHILSDLHLEDKNCDMRTATSRVDAIKADPRALAVLNGDLLNNATKGSVSDIYSETLSPMKAIDRVVALLFPIREQVIGADIGNHEWRTYKQDGIDIMRLVCRELGCEKVYNPEGVLIFLRFGSKPRSEWKAGASGCPMCYTIYATHGVGGGGKEGGKVNRLVSLENIVDADIYIHSHTHLPLAFPVPYNRTNVQNQTVREVDRWFVNDGSALLYGGYGQAACFKPSSRHSPVIHISGQSRLISATIGDQVYG
jgi:predicted phosphodiesterase